MKNKFSIFLLLFVVIFLNALAVKANITNRDKSEIIKFVLNEQISRMEAESPEEKSYLSAKNIQPKWIPRFKQLKLIFISPEEFEERRKQPNKYNTYYSFSEFREEEGLVKIDFERYFYNGDFAHGDHINFYTFKKVEGKWIGEGLDFSDSIP